MIIKKITTSPATTTLIPEGVGWGYIKSIMISNFSDNAADARVDIYYKEGANDLYLIKNCMIPKGATLVLDDGYEFGNSVYKLMSYSEGTAPALTIMIQAGNNQSSRR